MSVTSSDVPLPGRNGSWAFRNGCASRPVSQAKHLPVCADGVAGRTCADASERRDLLWRHTSPFRCHYTDSSWCNYTPRLLCVKTIVSPGNLCTRPFRGLQNRQDASMIPALPSHFFLLVVAFLMRGAAVLASVSDSNPSTAENLRPTAWATKNVMLIPAPDMA